MTLRQLYRRAASLKLAHEVANARTDALDTITSRRVQRGTEHNEWRKAGSRAGRVTMDRGFDAAVARLEARERMSMDRPWRFEQPARALS